ncbi:MAG: CAP domain-containing protein [Acidimicrobiales bacterium]|nr:CAP domain-containing protein [Acidimicrobiales bacterium]
MTPTRATKRIVTAAVAILLAITLSGCMTTGQEAVASYLNSDRRSHGLRSLPTSESLNRKAQAWADHLARSGSLSHSRLSSGVSGCWRRLAENVGYGSSARAVQTAYMKSSGHRANVLNSVWTHVGVGYAKRGSRVYTVQVFMQAC